MTNGTYEGKKIFCNTLPLNWSKLLFTELYLHVPMESQDSKAQVLSLRSHPSRALARADLPTPMEPSITIRGLGSSEPTEERMIRALGLGCPKNTFFEFRFGGRITGAIWPYMAIFGHMAIGPYAKKIWASEVSLERAIKM